nr:MAG TPA: Protein of unknown function (DUF2612) [Bacteriophage sp.]
MSKYTNLISNYHRDKPRFVDHIELSIRPLTDVSTTMKGLLTAFDLDNAVGAQLDIIGEWVGRNRRIAAPIEDYFFTLDSETLGFDLGSWKGHYTPESGIIEVDDEEYRTMLRAKIGANNWDGTVEHLKYILDNIYPKNNVRLSFTDNQDMTMTIYVDGPVISSITKEIIRQGFLSIKPLGVAAKYIINGE